LRQRRTERNVDLLYLRDRPGDRSSGGSPRRPGAAGATTTAGAARARLDRRRPRDHRKPDSSDSGRHPIDQDGTSIQFLSWLGLGLVSGYGIYSSIQFIRGKSAKLLIAALTLGVVVDVMTLIALPLLQPFMQDQEHIVNQIVPDDVDDASVRIRPFEERIDLKRIMFGIGLILVYTIFSLYLISPPVKKFIQSHGDRGI
jgi:hypothetical protein